jgi:hypothetical protein
LFGAYLESSLNSGIQNVRGKLGINLRSDAAGDERDTLMNK